MVIICFAELIETEMPDGNVAEMPLFSSRMSVTEPISFEELPMLVWSNLVPLIRISRFPVISKGRKA